MLNEVSPVWVERPTRLHVLHFCCLCFLDLTPVLVALSLLWNAAVHITVCLLNLLAKLKFAPKPRRAPRYVLGNPGWFMYPGLETDLLRTFLCDGEVHYELWNVRNGARFFMRREANKLLPMKHHVVSGESVPALRIVRTFEEQSVTYHQIENMANGDTYRMQAFPKPFLRVLRTFISGGAVHYEVLNTYTGDTYCMRGALT